MKMIEIILKLKHSSIKIIFFFFKKIHVHFKFKVLEISKRREMVHFFILTSAVHLDVELVEKEKLTHEWKRCPLKKIIHPVSLFLCVRQWNVVHISRGNEKKTQRDYPFDDNCIHPF